MEITKISGALYARMLACGARKLYSKKNDVNDLNVFPIPDGDTGDNMYMTINAGAMEAVGKDSLSSVAAAISHGMLLGARGNSGVILSRIFSGISKGIAEVNEADVKVLSAAMTLGVEESYHSVPVPVEGTILTVFSDAVKYANSFSSADIVTYFENLLVEMKQSLERTPDLLPVLRDAGVVDSGGAGLVNIFEGMLDALLGKDSAETDDSMEHAASQAAVLDFSAFDENDVLGFGYCTEFLLRLQTVKGPLDAFNLDDFTAHLQSVGDSVVAFREGSIVKVHIHTMCPGDILNYCQKYGEFLTLKIENMSLQHNETAAKKPESAAGKSSADATVRARRRKKFGIVTVASGKGLIETFTSLGVDEVIDGGQSSNPSAKDFLDAFDKVYADTIFVFPNNKNIMMTANQAAELYTESDIRVIKSRTIGEGYAAISMLDYSDGDADRVVRESEEVISGIVTGMVSRASRDTELDGLGIHKNDYIGFANGTIYVDGKDSTEVAFELCEKLGVDSYGVMLVLVGADANAERSRSLYDSLSKAHRDTEIIMIDGGQAIFDYIFVLE